MSESLVATAVNHGVSEIKERIEYLDGWRGLAIVLLLQAHFFGVKGMDTGRFAVDLFFVLSGFLMSHILFVKRVPLQVFYKRRISRILPVFVLFIMITYGVAGWLGQPWKLSHLLSTVTFFRTYFPSDPDIWNTGLPIGHIWTLNVEEHCYILLSLLAFVPLFRGREGYILIATGILSILTLLMYAKIPEVAPDGVWYLHTEVVASYLLISAGYYLLRDKFVPKIKPWMPLIAFLIAFVCYFQAVVPWTVKVIVSPFLLAFTMNHLSETYHGIKTVLTCSFLQLMGIWSYSIYLWQQPFYIYLRYHHDTMLFLEEVVILIAAIAIGVLSFYWFENPIRKMLNEKW